MTTAIVRPGILSVPQELKDAILQHHSAYPSTLASCALVHRTLTSTSQALLFRGVHLSGATRAHAFRESVILSPHLASLVTQLVITELDGPWVADAAPRLLTVFSALPNLTALAMRCGLLWSSEWDGLAVDLDVCDAPTGTATLLAHCANRLRVFEMDVDIDFWSSLIRPDSSVQFPALHTLIFSHHVWYESLVEDWLTVAPAIRRLVLWVTNGAKALRGLQVTEQGLVHGKPYWTDGEVMGGDWWLGSEVMEEGRNLERIEMVIYQEKTTTSGGGAQNEVQTEPLGVYECKDGRKVEVVTVMIPRMKDRRLNEASLYGGSGVEPTRVVHDAGHLPAPMRCHPPSGEVELAFLSKNSLNNVPDASKGLSVLSSEGKYLVVGPPDIAHAYGDHSVPLKVVIARHRHKNAMLSPLPCFIHRLPTEVLCAIFLMCGDLNKVLEYARDQCADSVSVHDETPSYIRSTIAIGSVCWRWFTTTRGCPQLWTVVDVPMPQPRDVAALQLSLKYSQGLSLSLRINDFHHTPKRNVKASKKFMALVAASASRWEELSIILYNEPPTVPDMASPLLDLPRNSFTSLKRAMVRFYNDDFEGTITSRLWDMFYLSPALHSAQWFYITVNAPPSFLQRLTHVGVETILPEHIVDLLRACHQLQVLQAVVLPEDGLLPGRNDGYLFQILPAPIFLPHLRILRLRGMYDWSHFFDGITAPNITRIEMVIAGVQANPICAMLKRSSACLDMLALRWLEGLAYPAGWNTMKDRKLIPASSVGGSGAEPLRVVQDARHLPSPIRCQLPSKEVELAFLSKDSLNDVPDDLKGLSVLSSEGKYLVVGPPVIAHAYGDHSVPLKVVIANHRRRNATLSPHPCFIHRLPIEVLCAIFLMCGDQNKVFDYTRDERMDSVSVHVETTFYIRSTVAIGCVCWRWYTITRGCPQLWTMVDVPLPQPRDVAAVQLSLKYSQGLPLALRLNDFHYSPKRDVKACRAFMALIAASADRWKELSIILFETPPTVHDMISPLLSMPHDSFASLERAMLRFYEDDVEDPAASRLWQTFYASPTLRAARWFYVEVDAPPSTLLHLTHVGVEVVSPEHILELVQACPQLQALQAVVLPAEHILAGRDDGYLIPTLSAPIYLSDLRTLTLRGMYDFSQFFNGITTPRISRLEMVIAGVQATPICAMLRRSSASLEMLALRWIYPGSDDEVAGLLQSREIENLKVLRYVPYQGIEREPDRFDPSPYLPPNLVAFTKNYDVAENVYRSLHSIKHRT